MEKKLKIIPNPDRAFYEEVAEAVYQNHGYCCCGIKHTEDMKCMCKDFRNKNTPGPCNCGRYIKVQVNDE